MIYSSSICLLMMVKDESATIERCLVSARAHIDHWLIADTGCSDDTSERAKAMLADIPGEVVELPFTDFSTIRNQLRDLGRGLSDYTLWLDADETLVVGDDSEAEFTLEAPGYLLEICTSDGSYLLPRLIQHDARCVFTGEVAETIVGLDDLPVLNGWRIQHHEDGFRWRDPVRLKREMLQLENALLDAPRNPLLLLPYARCLASQGRCFEALSEFRKFSRLDVDPPHLWYANYQAARMLDRMDCSAAKVIEAYHQAFELNPAKIEPLVRIARHLRRAGQSEAALNIILAALEAEAPDREFYYEPRAWSEERILEYLRINLELNRFSLVIDAAEYQLALGGHQKQHIQQLASLREQALEQRASNPDLEYIPPPKQAAGCHEIRHTYTPGPILDATPMGQKKKMCIGMATFDDYDGVFFSIQAIRMFHTEILEEVEFVVIDNNPTGPAAKPLKALEHAMDNYRYVPQAEAIGTIAKDYIFRAANSDYVLVMDCHVLVASGALRRLIDYFDEHPDTADLLQGPLVYDDLKSLSTHFEPQWRGGMWGTWELDSRGSDPEAVPFEIPMQGCGLFACRADAWPGFNPRFRGFGSEEGYIHEKIRQAGGRTLCLPFLRWLHRFNRPFGVTYPNIWTNRIRNYMIGWTELGLDLDPVRAHFKELLGATKAVDVFAKIEHELKSPLHGYDSILYFSDPAHGDDTQLLESLGIDQRVIKLESSDEDSFLPVAGKALKDLAQSSSNHCLLINDLQALDNGQAEKARAILPELEQGSLNHAILAGEGKQPDRVNLVLHSRLFSLVATALPNDRESVPKWLAEHGNLTQFLRNPQFSPRSA